MATSTIANPVAKIHGIDILFADSLVDVNDEITLTHPISDYYFILLHFQTNSEHQWQLIPTEFIPIGNGMHAIHCSIFGSASSGRVDYPPNYNSSINVQFVSANTIKCIMSIYNNINFRVALNNVYGIWKKS